MGTTRLSASLLLACAIGLAFTCASAKVAQAQALAQSGKPEPRYGEAGQVVITGQLSADLGFLHYDNNSASSSYASIQPAFDYFFRDHWLIGVATSVRYDALKDGYGNETDTLSFGAGFRFGGDIPIGKRVSVQPVVGLAFVHEHNAFTGPPPSYVESAPVTGVNETVVVASVFAPLLVHPAAHVFLGIGPDA